MGETPMLRFWPLRERRCAVPPSQGLRSLVWVPIFDALATLGLPGRLGCNSGGPGP